MYVSMAGPYSGLQMAEFALAGIFFLAQAAVDADCSTDAEDIVATNLDDRVIRNTAPVLAGYLFLGEIGRIVVVPTDE